MKNIKVGIDAFNDLAKSHDAHVKEVERLQKQLDCVGIDISTEKGKVDIIELEEFKLKLVSENGELLLECRIGDKYHQALLELGITKLLEDYLKE